MATGAEQAQRTAAEPDWLGPAADAPQVQLQLEAEPDVRHRRVGMLGPLLFLLALGWIGAAGWSVWQARPELSLAAAVSWIATFSAPLILLALLWLLFGRTSRRETERFTRAVEAMRTESVALESVLEIVSGRIEDNQARLRDKAEKLMSLGDEASDRLGRVTHYLSKETATLDRHSAALEAAAAAA